MIEANASAVRRSLRQDAAAMENAMFMEAVVAAYALMAHADGEVASAERRRLFAMIRDTAAFEIFSRDDVADEAAVHEANYALDPELAQQIAWEKIDLIAGQRRATHVVIGACRELIAADGIGHPAEYRMLAEIKSRLGIDDLPPHA